MTVIDFPPFRALHHITPRNNLRIGPASPIGIRTAVDWKEGDRARRRASGEIGIVEKVIRSKGTGVPLHLTVRIGGDAVSGVPSRFQKVAD